MATREDRARELREKALALIAEAEQEEQEELPPNLAEQLPHPRHLDPIDAALARMDGWLEGSHADIAVVAWSIMQETWDRFDGDQTLTLAGRLLDILYPQAVDEPVEEPLTDADIAAHVRGERFDPRVAELLGQQAFGEMSAPPEQPAPVVSSRIDPPADSRPPVGMRVRRRPSPPAQRAPAHAGEEPGARTRADDPRLAEARAQAMRQPPQVGQLKAGAPRKASGHSIPPHLQQWKRDASGRRVPVDTPNDPE